MNSKTISTCLISTIGLLVIFLCFNCVFSEIVKFRLCNTSKYCKIVNVSVTPCKEAKRNLPCKVQRGKNLTWTFTFIPLFSGREDSLRVQSYSHFHETIDVPEPNQNTNACLYTKCPFDAGVQRTLTYSSPIRPSYPKWKITTKWKLWNEKNENCCFMSDIQIV